MEHIRQNVIINDSCGALLWLYKRFPMIQMMTIM